jgi:microcystin degradation protein MlrC
MINSYPTSREPMRSYVDRISAMEGKNGVVSIYDLFLSRVSEGRGRPIAEIFDREGEDYFRVIEREIVVRAGKV